MSRQLTLQVVFFEEAGWWIAQCLERNLVASAREPRDLKRKLDAVIRGQLEADAEAGVEALARLPQAPRRFWEMFRIAEPWAPREEGVDAPFNTPARTEMTFALEVDDAASCLCEAQRADLA